LKASKSGVGRKPIRLGDSLNFDREMVESDPGQPGWVPKAGEESRATQCMTERGAEGDLRHGVRDRHRGASGPHQHRLSRANCFRSTAIPMACSGASTDRGPKATKGSGVYKIAKDGDYTAAQVG
jgi:hypothetical protein